MYPECSFICSTIIGPVLLIIGNSTQSQSVRPDRICSNADGQGRIDQKITGVTGQYKPGSDFFDLNKKCKQTSFYLWDDFLLLEYIFPYNIFYK